MKTEKTNGADKEMEKLGKFKARLNTIDAKIVELKKSNEEKIAELTTERNAIQESARGLLKEMSLLVNNMGTGGSGRGRGSESFGKVKERIVTLLSKGESLPAPRISDEIGASYPAVYQQLKKNPGIFALDGKVWKLKDKVAA